MRRVIRSFPLTAIVFLLIAQTIGEASNITNRLAMYFIADKVPRDDLVNGTAKVNEMTLAREPILSDSDFLAYSVTNHQFTITAEAAKRLAIGTSGRGTAATSTGVVGYHLDGERPFVLVASGERIYVGIFSSPTSSTMYFFSPFVYPSVPFVPEHSASPIKLRINFQVLPNDKRRDAPDPRDDPRFLTVVKALGL